MIFRKFLNIFKVPVDIILSILILPSSIILFFFRKIGGHKFKISKYILKKIGVFPIIKNYYEPRFDFDYLKFKLDSKRNLPGINFNISNQLSFLKSLKYTDELKKLDLTKNTANYGFHLKNNFFEAGDAEIYYQMIRHFKPKKILEIGSGFSSLLALEAIKKNLDEDKTVTNLICVEPYENKWLEKKGADVLRKKIENVNKEQIFILEENDILFIDSSHVIKPQGDILKIFLEILPLLKKGTIIHIHDIFSPRDYPEKWLKEENRFYNEQYLLEAIMEYSDRYKILLSLNYLKNDHFNEFKKFSPYIKNDSQPSSLYLKIN